MNAQLADMAQAPAFDVELVGHAVHNRLYDGAILSAGLKKPPATRPSNTSSRCASKRLLENSPKSIGEIMLETGYSDNKTFRALFIKYTGYALSVYRSRYQRQLA